MWVWRVETSSSTGEHGTSRRIGGRTWSCAQAGGKTACLGLMLGEREHLFTELAAGNGWCLALHAAPILQWRENGST